MSSEGLPVSNVVGVGVDLGARSTEQATDVAKSSLSADSAAESADAAFKFMRSAKSDAQIAREAAESVQNIADANTYYTTPTDPDGTIAGLAGTPEGDMFRVAIPDAEGISVVFNWYKNNAGAAEFINSEPSTRYITSIPEEANQYTDDVVGFNLSGIEILAGSNYIRTSDGSLQHDENWENSSYIEVKEKQKIKLTAVCESDAQANIAFFDENKILLSLGRTGSNNHLETGRFSAPADGFIIVCTRTGTNAEFLCAITNRAVAIESLDTVNSASSTHTALSLAATGEIVVPLSGEGGVSTMVAGYVDNAGVINASATRRYRTLSVQSGDTVFYSGKSHASATDINQVPAALFVAGSSVTVIKGNPLSLNGVSYYSDKYTAVTPGTVYINVDNDTANAEYPWGFLFGGRVNKTILHRPSLVAEESIDATVVSTALHRRDTDVITANGEPKNITSSVEKIVNAVLYSNGAWQDLSASSTPDSWATALVPVRVGDVVTYYGVFNTSPTSQLSYISQLDVQKGYVSELLQNTPVAGYQTVNVTAVADGYIAIRVRLKNADGSALTHSIRRTGPKYFDFGGGPVVKSGGAIAAGSMTPLPVKLDTTWLYNSPSYQQNGIVTAGDYQYVVCIAEGRNPHILQRSIYGGQWNKFNLATVPANPFNSPNAEDGHNSFSIEVTKDGYILVSGNHHSDPCRCAISASPHDITAWSAISYTDSTVTYPRFLRYPDGTLQVFWRQGGSGNGDYWVANFDDVTRTFKARRLLIDATIGNPYEQTIGIGLDGALHLCWGYRVDGGTADSNYGLFYAKSTDKGLTFTSADGASNYAVPLMEGNAEKPVDLLQGSGYVNQNGGCVDLDGRYHTVYWQNDSRGYTQIIHLWFDGATWKTETVSDFTYTEITNESRLTGASSRPQICCTRYGKIYVIYRTTEDGLAGQVRAIDVTTPGVPVDYQLVSFNVFKTELSVNVWEVLNTGVLSMMLYTGVNRVGDNLQRKYLSEPCWLFQAQLP